VTLPSELRAQLEAELGPVRRVEGVGGGCISGAYRLELGGGALFLKAQRSAPPGFFAAEAAGLRELGGVASGPRVPEVHGHRDVASGWSWIALEWLEPRQPRPADGAVLGERLATLHRAAGGGWGWERDGFIGTLPQANGSCGRWADFWYRRRLAPQLRNAGGPSALGRAADWRRLEASIPQLLAVGDEEGPSPLHGDLWSGNVLATDTGPALVDPAFYQGHREVDLAMADLFGGFDEAFHDAYAAAWPLRPGYRVRRDVYQLYYLLVHVNLFGAAYVNRTVQTLNRVLTER
jgi:fructosamine-3-kinase